MNQQPEPSPIFSLIPLAVIAVALFFVLIPVAKRKGKRWPIALWAFVPGVNAFVGYWLCSLTDKDVLDRIAALEKTQR